MELPQSLLPLVLSLPGADAGSLSLVTTANMIPLVLFMLIGGVAADRFGRTHLVGVTDIIGSVFVAVSAFAFISGHASIPLLCFNGFVFGVLNALWYPAFVGIMPLIVRILCCRQLTLWLVLGQI